MVLIGRPVGELRRAYRDLAQAHDELKRAQGRLVNAEKMASLGRLVAGVAH
jgi:two-component system sensor histidine kinase HupT/HoxJ